MRPVDAIRTQLDDRQALIGTLYGEAAGESLDGQLAVAWAIRNRVLVDLNHDGKPNNWWGNSIHDVCMRNADPTGKYGQFDCWWLFGTGNTTRLYAFADLLLDGGPFDPATAALVKRLGWIADGVISGAAPDLSNKATHYLTTALLSTAPPAWARGLRPCAIVDHHSFFNNVP